METKNGFTTFVYDPTGRVISVILPDGTIVSELEYAVRSKERRVGYEQAEVERTSWE